MADQPFSCTCGKVAGHLTEFTPRMGTHAVCHCSSCRAAELHCGAADPGTEGVHIFQTSPARLRITKGAENLVPFSFGPKNLLRWRAACCNTPMFNTPRNPRMSFVGIRASVFEDISVLGPVAGHAFKPQPNGKTRHENLIALMWRPIARIAKARLTGAWRDTPFFDASTGNPINPVEVLPKGTRKQLLG